MDHLSKLPEELQLRIYKYLDKRQDFYGVSSSCWKLNRIMEPLLYSSFEESGERDTPLLVRTLLNRPELAKNFKTFLARCYNIQKITGPFYNQHSTATRQLARVHLSTRELIGAHLWGLTSSFDMGGRWLEALYDCRRNWAPWTALLLMLLPNIESVYLPEYCFAANPTECLISTVDLSRARTGMENEWLDFVWSKASRRTSHGQPILTKLKDVCLRQKDILASTGVRAVVDDDITPFLRIPSVTRLHCTIHRQPSAFFDFSEEGSHLQHLVIETGLPFSGLLREAPCTLRGLKSLTCRDQIDGESFNRDVWDTCSIAPQLKALKSLEELVLTPNMGTMRDEWKFVKSLIEEEATEALTEPIGTLVEFKKLKRIESTMFILMGEPLGRQNHATKPHNIRGEWYGIETRDQESLGQGEAVDLIYEPEQINTFLDSLPESLEELMIWNCRGSSIVNVLLKLIAAVKQDKRFRKLRNVDLVFDQSWKGAGKYWKGICGFRGKKSGGDGFVEAGVLFTGRQFQDSSPSVSRVLRPITFGM